jgi:hypothetical protein
MWVLVLMLLVALTAPHEAPIICAGGCNPFGPEYASVSTQTVPAAYSNPLIQPDTPGGCDCLPAIEQRSRVGADR